MRYLLMFHGFEDAQIAKGPLWLEEAMAFLLKFEDELALNSELEWAETLDDEENSVVIGPGGETREGWYNEEGKPLRRLWAVRTSDPERIKQLAGQLAGELDTWIEVRKTLPTAMRP